MVLVVAAGLFYIAGQFVASQPQRIKQEAEANREITVQGTGKVQIKPDIAKISLGITTGPQATAAVAMNMLSQKFNAVMTTIRQQGIKDTDIKTTNLSINPIYDYNNGRQTLRGFEAQENIEVKIRDLGKIGEVLAKTTVDGVNQVGGVQFVIDSPEKAQTEAQKNAIKDAEEKARELSRSLGVTLGKVKSFSSYNVGDPTPLYDSYGRGGAGNEKAVTSPEVPVGMNEVVSNVNIVYELK